MGKIHILNKKVENSSFLHLLFCYPTFLSICFLNYSNQSRTFSWRKLTRPNERLCSIYFREIAFLCMKLTWSFFYLRYVMHISSLKIEQMSQCIRCIDLVLNCMLIWQFYFVCKIKVVTYAYKKDNNNIQSQLRHKE